MFARFHGRRASATASTLPTSPAAKSGEAAPLSSSGTSGQQYQQRPSSSSSSSSSSRSQLASSLSSAPLSSYSSSDAEATKKAFEEASKMLEELRTVLDNLDQLLMKISPPPIVTPLLATCLPQSQPPLVSQSQKMKKNYNGDEEKIIKEDKDDEHDDHDDKIISVGITASDKYIGNPTLHVVKDQNGIMGNDVHDDESDRGTKSNYCDTTNIQNYSDHNENGTDHKEDDDDDNIIDSSPTLSSSASSNPPIITRTAKFVTIHPTDVDEIIECLRRSAEIVALSERRAGALEAEVAMLASSRLERRRSKRDRRRKKKENDEHDNSNDSGQKNESQSTIKYDENHIRQNEDRPQNNHGINDDYDDDKKTTEDVDHALRLLPYHLAPFELFCERNVLSKIVGLVTGSTFDTPQFPPTYYPLPTPLQPQDQSLQHHHHQSSSFPSPTPPPPTSTPPLLLPPLSIATQAVQSASILIQNVCRATSLYLLLSNNVINELIGLPLESYRRACEVEEADADEKDLGSATAAMTSNGRKWGQHYLHQQQQQQQQSQLEQQQQLRRRHRQQRHQQEISELTTHFVSFLKGLAMRVNAETLQFFLSFPPITTTRTLAITKNGSKNECLQRGGRGWHEQEVEFPLYARALEFCSPLPPLPTTSSLSSPSSSLLPGVLPRNLSVMRGGEEERNYYHLDDPFVRITAMSVCMNILRLVTYHHIDDDDDDHSLESVVDHYEEEDDDLINDDKDEDAKKLSSEDHIDIDLAEDDKSREPKVQAGVITEGNSEELRKEQSHKNQKQSQYYHDHQKNSTPLPTSTPTGLLHKNPPVLPLQDRIAIAEYACHPTRVSELVSPLCVRLTTQFGQVEGMVRMLEELDRDKSGIEDYDSTSAIAAVETTSSTNTSTSSIKTSSITSTTTPSSSSFTTPRGRNEQEEKKKQQKIHIHKQRLAAERTRLCNTMQNLVANVQDELLLLDDLLKVGLISLNEQVIEMLLATFVYPMLLQPLLLPVHRHSDEEQKDLSASITPQSFAPFSSILCSTKSTADDDAATASASTNVTETPCHRQFPLWTRRYNCSDLAPSKTALHGLSLVFRTISNPTFRRLLLVALLHPLSPRATGGRPVVRSRPQITLRKGSGGDSGTTKERKKKKEKMRSVSSSSRDDALLEIRTDSNQEQQSVVYGEPNRIDANLYSFGTQDSTNNEVENDDSATTSGSNCQLVFILAPALVDILRRGCDNHPGGQDHMSSSDELAEELLSPRVTMTRPNPYRNLLLSSLAGSAEMSALQPLATTLLHAAVSSADNSMIQRIMFPQTDSQNRYDAVNSIETESGEEALICLCLSIVNTLATYDGWWKVNFNTVAAHTLVSIISDEQISFVNEQIGKIRHVAVKFLLAIPSRLDAKYRDEEAEITNVALPSAEKRPSALVDKQYLDSWLIDRFFFDRADKFTISVVENVCCIREYSEEEDATEEKYRYGLKVLTATPVTESYALLCDGATVVDGMVVAAESVSNTSFHCAASWALACLYLDAFHGKITKMLHSATDNGEAGGLQNTAPRKKLSHISPTCSRNEDDSSQEEGLTSYSLAHISSQFTIAMLDEYKSSSLSSSLSLERNNSETSYNSTSMTTPPEYGSAVGLVGRAAFPCVIEVSSPASSSLFTGRTCISNEGVRWQSLYLVVIGKWAVFAEPGRDGTSAAGGEGRVVASCKLACLSLRRDSSSVANDMTNAARRLLVSHTSLDPRPPPLFVVDSSAASALPRRGGSSNGGGVRAGNGPNLDPNGLRLTRSRMDLWFEDYNAGERARKVLSAKIAKARAKRGERLSAALIIS